MNKIISSLNNSTAIIFILSIIINPLSPALASGKGEAMPGLEEEKKSKGISKLEKKVDKIKEETRRNQMVASLPIISIDSTSSSSSSSFSIISQPDVSENSKEGLLPLGKLSSCRRLILDEEKDIKGSQELKKSVLKVLNNLISPDIYQRGEFSFQGNPLTGIYITSFYSKLKKTNLTDEISRCEQHISLNVSACEDRRCRIIDDQVPSIQKQTSQEARLSKSKGKRIKDKRVYVEHPEQLPYHVHGHLITTFENGKRYVSSGTLIGSHHVLTSGHNIYSHQKDEGWATSIRFIPALNGEIAPFGEAQGVILLSVQNWTEDHDKNYDFGMVILDKPIGYRAGWAGIFTGPDEILKQNNLHISGYPGDHGRMHKQSTQMWTMEGKITEINKNRVTYDIFTYPGQDGASVWAKWKDYQGCYIVGIHRDDESHTAIKISTANFARLVSWMGEYQLSEGIHSNISSSEEKHARKLKEGAKKGDTEAQYQLGICYTKGKGIKRDDRKAFKWYKKAAKQGHQMAKYRLAECYLHGIGIEKDIILARNLLLKINSDTAQILLGMIYRNGEIDGKPDFQKARECFERVSEKSNNASFQLAQVLLGTIYRNGEADGTPNYRKAEGFFEKAAAQGNEFAQYQLGMLYYLKLIDVNGKPDFQKAKKYFEGAPSLPEAQHMLGVMYLEGEVDGTPNYQKAKQHLEEASKKKHSDAQYLLGSMYLAGFKGEKPDFKKAKQYFEEAAEQAHEIARFGLGIMYLYGEIDGKPNPQMAKKYFEEISEQEHLNFHTQYALGDIQYTIGMKYLNGEIDGKPNPQMAREYFERAAAQEHPDAQYELGEMDFMTGFIDGKPNFQKYKQDLEKAAEQGSEAAHFALKVVYEEDDLKARKLLSSAAKSELDHCKQIGFQLPLKVLESLQSVITAQEVSHQGKKLEKEIQKRALTSGKLKRESSRIFKSKPKWKPLEDAEILPITFEYIPKYDQCVYQFDVVYADLDGSRGEEIHSLECIDKARPCLVISPNTMNKGKRLIVAPMTTNAERSKLFPNLKSNFDGVEGSILLDQIRTIDKDRIKRRKAYREIAPDVLVKLKEMWELKLPN